MDHLVSMAKTLDSYCRYTSGWIGYNISRDVLCCPFPKEVNLRCYQFLIFKSNHPSPLFNLRQNNESSESIRKNLSIRGISLKAASDGKNLSMMSYEVREGQKLLNALENAGNPTYPKMLFLMCGPQYYL